MGTQCRLARIVVLTAVLLAGSTAALAEVAAEVDINGRYLRMVVVSRASITDVSVWSEMLPRPRYVPLNPAGDRNGDLWPVIAEGPEGPWVIWSRFNGIDYDLAWSRWRGMDWGGVQWLEGVPRSGDDLDPDVMMDAKGRPHVAWWTDSGGKGRVYLSMYLDTRWMAPYPVSPDDLDSRDPQVTVNADGSITVDFMTPDGLRSRTIWVISGHSINDDFDPFASMEANNLKR